MSTMTAAVLGCLVYWILGRAEHAFLSWQCLSRPIVVAPIMGLMLGDFQTGIIMGAALESIFMGVSAIGGSVPSDGLSASIIAVTYTVVTGSDIEAGLAIALPIGTAMSSFNGMFTPFFSALAPYWEKVATTKPKSLFTQTVVFDVFINPIPNLIVLFFGLAYGVTGLNSFLASLPPFVMVGLSAASSMMIAVGFAILLSMIWSPNISYFFFIGYILAKVVGLDSLSIAIVGAAIAITLFLNDKKLIDMKATLAQASTNSDEEDFF